MNNIFNQNVFDQNDIANNVQRLFDEKLIPTPIIHTPAQIHTLIRPWYINLLLGVSGWFGGLFLLFFVALLLKPESGAAASTVGLFLIASAWLLLKVDRAGNFFGQLGLALSLAGQCLLIYAFNEYWRRGPELVACTVVLQLILAITMPNYLHRMLSTLFACASWAIWMRLDSNGHFFAAMPLDLASAIAMWLAVWLPVLALTLLLIRTEARWVQAKWSGIARPILSGLILGLAFATLISHPIDSFGGFGVTKASFIALWPLLSVLAALVALAGAFYLRSTPLIGACIVGALLHLSHFYYMLGTSLLVKSIILLLMGCALLASSVALKRISDEMAGDVTPGANR